MYLNYYDDVIATEATLSEPAARERRVLTDTAFLFTDIETANNLFRRLL
jgi:hypothetical protein